MIHFLSRNLGTIIVSLILIALVLLAIHILVSNRKKGRSSCGCGCEGCPSAGVCHSADQKNTDR